MSKVFVYGTLKAGEPNHYWLLDPKNGHSTFISKAVTLEKYPLVIATIYNIPFLLYEAGLGHFIHGEVYEVDDNMLKNLDILEDHPQFYERVLMDVKLESDTPSTTTCWIYFLKRYQNDMMQKEMFAEYKNNGSHGLKYCELNNESTIDDL